MAQVLLPRTIDGPGAVRLLNDIHRAGDDPARDAVVFTGSDGVFCDGLDLGGLVAADAGRDEIAAAMDAFAQCLSLLRCSPKPTMALVDGTARGGGLGFAAACDVVIATDRSHFALPELLWGLLPAVVYASLRERLTVQQCRLWMLMGGARTAAEAWASGLVDDVVRPAALGRARQQWERKLSRARPETVVRLRRFLGADVTEPVEAARRGIALTTDTLMDEQLRASLRLFHDTGALPWETT